MAFIHLCLSELLDQDITAFEYFQTLPPAIQSALAAREISTFSELQHAANSLKHQLEISRSSFPGVKY